MVVGAPPLAAQTTSGQPTTNATDVTAQRVPAPPATTNTVGPRELQNFNLGGNTERPAATVPAPATAQPAPSPVPATRQATPTVADRPASARPATTVARPSTPVETVVAEPSRPSSTGPSFSLPSLPQAAPTTPVEMAPAAPAPATLPPAPAPERSNWPWLLAGLAVAAGLVFLFWKRSQPSQQQVPAMAAPAPMPRAVPEPKPAPAPRPVRAPATLPPPSNTINARMPAPAAAPSDTINARAPVAAAPTPETSGGIVSRALKPQLAFEFTPLRAELNEAGIALLSFELVVTNNGSAPARDVLVETTMINAGAKQDEEIANFFRNPVGRGDRIPVIAPMAKMTFRTRVPLTPERLNPIEIEGRKLLVPIVAINALYAWSGGDAQRSASFLVGRGGADGGKMGTFSLDRGARAWDWLTSRQHSAGLNA
jgi:hypothetical protein